MTEWTKRTYKQNQEDLKTATSPYVDDGGKVNKIPLDKSTGALITVTYAHHEIHGGSHYTITYGVADIGAATTPDDAITLTFTTADTSSWPHMVLLFESVGGALCRLREGGTGGGSPSGVITCKNNNRNSSKTSGLLDISSTAGQVSYDAGLDTGGTLLVDEYISGASTNQNKAGGGAQGGARYEWILKQNTRYQVSIFSAANVASSIVLHWYEHRNKS